MKFSILAISLLMPTTAMASDWRMVGGNEEAVWYLDNETVVRTGTLSTVWLKIAKAHSVEADPTSPPIFSGMRAQYDCRNLTQTFVTFVVYKIDGEAERTFDVAPARRQTISPIPDTVGMTALRVACGLQAGIPVTGDLMTEAIASWADLAAKDVTRAGR